MSQNNICKLFWSNVWPDKHTKCWNWIGYKGTHGYGTFYTNRKPRLAHRFSYTLCKGPIGKRMFILHKCNNRLCVNPLHLYEGTQAENVLDISDSGRRKKGSKLPHSKLTETDVYLMRFLRRKGSTYIQLSEWFGVNPSTCSAVCLGKTWRHVEY